MRRIGQRHQRGAYRLGVAPSRLRQPDTPAIAGEERGAELLLQRANLMADGAMRDKELIGGAGETLVPRSSLEHAQCIERGKLSQIHCEFISHIREN